MLKKFLSSLVLIIIISSITAQEVDYSTFGLVDYKKSTNYIIKDISVSGIQYLDKNIIINLSGLSIDQGIEVPGEDITNALQKIWKQGLFSDVKISASKIVNDSIYLNIYLQERNRLSDFNIYGVKKSEVEDIKEALEIKRGKQVTENILNNSERIIKNYLKDKKYLNAEVDMVIVDDTIAKMNNVILNVHVKKNNKVKIEEIIYDGNKMFSDNKLNRIMKNTSKKNLNFFKASKFKEDDYKTDKEEIIKKYHSKGYRDAKIVKDSVYVINDKRIGIYMQVEEGNQYFFRNIDWVGNTKYSSDVMDVFLKIKKGDPYDTELLNERLNIDEDAVSNLYLDDGHLFFNLTPVITKIENDSIDLQMRISEGDQVTLNNVIIKGNTRTNEHVIRREMRTKPGMLFSKADIIRSQRELAQLNYFDPEQFGIEPININQSEGTVDLEYTVVEKSTDQLEVSGGWGNNMFVGSLGVRFSNFSISNVLKKGAWKPIPSGDGQTLSLRLQTNGQYYSTYSLSFIEPWLGGEKPNSLSVSAYYSVQKRTDYFYQVSDEFIKILGFSVGLGQRLKWPDDYFTISNSLNYQIFNLNDWGGFIISDGVANNLSFNTVFARNSIDAPIYPRRGSTFSLSLQFTPPYSLFKEDNFWELSTDEEGDVKQDVIDNYNSLVDEYGNNYNWDELSSDDQDYRVALEVNERSNAEKYNWVEYHKWKYKGAWYLKIWKDLVLATNSEFGYLGYYNQDIGYAPFGRFNLGGDGLSGYSLYGVETIGLRGYENNSLTPYDSDGKGAGNVYEKINFELRYPITLKPQATIYVLGFVEAGNAWSSISDYNPFKIKRSAGVGIRAFLPMFGLLGVDWGYGFDEVAGRPDANGAQFHFVIGQQF